MVQVCSRCTRANPGDAIYCYYDGFVLTNGVRNASPLAIGAQVFSQPFVFTDGHRCRSFDELALACQDRWTAARELLQQGYLEKFFGGLGRMDLVLAAQKASQFPDLDRGLDQLLSQLPSEVLSPPQLAVETTEINLGQLQVGSRGEFEIQLENQGMRLLHGTIDCAQTRNIWLTLGDAPGITQKHFQFGREQSFKVHVCGDRLRANSKPLEARIHINSNGGRATLTVRVSVPVIPFTEGVLAGSLSPRELASRAKNNTRETAPLFENGSVENWYRVNGWSYPVTGPTYSGLHAIQQFFEALGLVKPPLVEIDVPSMNLQGNPGEPLSFEIKVSSEEKKPVYAHAISDQPWLEPGRARLSGRTAIIPVQIPAIPQKPGQNLRANLRVLSNGDQSFDIPVTLAVTGNPFSFGEAVSDAIPMASVVDDVPLLASPLDFTATPGPSRRKTSGIRPPAPSLKPATPPPPPDQPIPSSSGNDGQSTSESRIPLGLHLLPAILLGLAVALVMIYDLVRPLQNGSGGNGGGPREPASLSGLNLQFHEKRHGSFGLEITGVPDPTHPGQLKRITYDDRGAGDNIIVKIDDFEYFMSQESLGRTRKIRPLSEGRIGQTYSLFFKESQVEVEQRVELVKGPTGQMDTCLIDFTITNHDKTNVHDVGLRVLMDTYIGGNDGVPFTIPGRKGFLNTMEEFREKQIPDYIEAIENPDNPSDLGTIVRLGLKNLNFGGGNLEPVDRLRICLYPGSQTKWDWEMKPMNKGSKKDSCVAIYWATVKMNPGEVRHLGYTYGLSELSIGTGESPMALSAPALVLPNSEMLVTAYVWNVRKGSKIEIDLPAEFKLASNESAVKTIEETSSERVQVSWRVKTTKAGVFEIKTRLGSSTSRPIKIRVETRLF